MSVLMRQYHYRGSRNPIEDSVKMGHLWPFYDLKDYDFLGMKDVGRDLPTAEILKLTAATQPFSLVEIEGEGIHFGLIRNVAENSPPWLYAEEDKENSSTVHCHSIVRLLREPGSFRALYASQPNLIEPRLPLKQDNGAAYETVWEDWGMLRVPYGNFANTYMANQIASFLAHGPTSPLPRPFMLGDVITTIGTDYGLLPNGWQPVKAV